MKKIKVKAEYEEFKAVLNGTISYDLTHEWLPVKDEDLDFINNKYGALVEIEGMTIEEAIPVLQAESVVKEEVKAEDIKPKRAKKNGSSN